MLSKNEIKFIRSLQQKKFRDQEKLFVVEGEKMAQELLNSNYKIHSTYATANWIAESGIEATEVSGKELERISGLKHPNKVISLVGYYQHSIDSQSIYNGLSLVLDDVRDPGNLGTIIRLADWFGIQHIICSKQTVDAYNPKVVQATMGSFFRVQLHYTDLDLFLNEAQENDVPIYATVLDGSSVYEADLSATGLIVMGSESHGVSEQLEKYFTHRIKIPSFGKAESLNVAMATGIICSEFKRRN
jgi:TrmH family RNA methyltransferase